MKPVIFATLAGMSLGALAACDRTPERPAEPTPLASFDKADANKDGVIERQEATSIANQDFSDVDTDDNQAVSLDEFEVALRKWDRPPG
jgi:predicted HAD superfamily Cof-like phosphohydrolase